MKNIRPGHDTEEEWTSALLKTGAGCMWLEELERAFHGDDQLDAIKEAVFFSCDQAVHFDVNRYWPFFKADQHFQQTRKKHIGDIEKIIEFIRNNTNLGPTMSPEYIELAHRVFSEKLKEAGYQDILDTLKDSNALPALAFLLAALECYREALCWDGPLTVNDMEGYFLYGCIVFPNSLKNRTNKPTRRTLLCIYLLCLFRNLSLGLPLKGHLSFPSAGKQKPRHRLVQMIVQSVFPPCNDLDCYDDTWAKTTERRFLRDNPGAKISVDWSPYP